MQTGSWLNIKRDNTLMTELGGLAVVCVIAVPALLLIGFSALIINMFNNKDT
jgi:hypothetical protein